MTPFRLSELVKHVMHSAPECDPPRLAKLVEDAIPDEHRAEALHQALPIVLQNALSRDRTHHTPPAHNVRPADHANRGAQAPSVGGADPVSSGYSARRRALASIPPQEWWRGELDKAYNVGPGRHDWKRLRDCTIPDLRYAQNLRHRNAASNAAAAERLGTLIGLMTRAHADTVGTLDRRLAAAS